MKDYILEKFDLTINDKNDDTCSCSVEPLVGLAHQITNRKIYIVTTLNKEFLYIGEANTKLITRLQRGCNSFNYYIKGNKPRGGYKGYKWLDKMDNPERNLLIYVAIFTNDYDNNRKEIESIEGELVYFVRCNLNYWPKFQNEIHFSNSNNAKLIALRIYEQICRK